VQRFLEVHSQGSVEPDQDGHGRVTLPAMDPEPGEEVFFHGHPSWRSMLAFYIKGFFGAVLAGVIAGIVTRIAGGSVSVPLVVAVVLIVFVLVVVIGLVRRIATTYTITNRRLTIDIGLLSRALHETRLERVQNVNTRQSVLERMLRVGTVDFDTAGSADFDFAFRGVDDPRQIVRTVDRALHELQQHTPGPRV
jgi:uncharacterized membrane protein YdbT with pleckstrin-like domain